MEAGGVEEIPLLHTDLKGESRSQGLGTDVLHHCQPGWQGGEWTLTVSSVLAQTRHDPFLVTQILSACGRRDSNGTQRPAERSIAVQRSISPRLSTWVGLGRLDPKPPWPEPHTRHRKSLTSDSAANPPAFLWASTGCFWECLPAKDKTPCQGSRGTEPGSWVCAEHPTMHSTAPQQRTPQAE